ncbi:winged helix-turn-helix transcriptional regulator [Salibaculum halophilum]|uniref:winged helix-turn-helix transcriptional regulator n=1 Tax=Salibaculum halophilum TaxID=1914408 RepID=UPI000A10A0BC|nr:helix-turn-helix domain-containing protein [Salibaculum halophilum]
MLEPRWTMLILCEMWSGSTRFSEIQRGVPGMSPSLLSKRLREMTDKGLIKRFDATDKGGARYATTAMADELEPVVNALGSWAHRHIDPEPGLECLDARVLLWNVRRKIDVSALPRLRSVVEFILKARDQADFHAWLIIRPNAENDLCMVDPKDEVDLFITADLKALTAAWMGHTTFASEIEADRIQLIGDALMASNLSKWLIRSSFAIQADSEIETPLVASA